MAFMKYAALVLAAALGACAELTAEAPLFSPADQVGPPPLTEGVWIALGDECPRGAERRRRFPAECSPLQFRRLADGAWEARLRVDLISRLSREQRAEAAEMDDPLRFVIVPAVERSTPDAFAPLYVAEIVRSGEQPILYAVVAPIGSMPATEVLVIGSIGCRDILADGPIDGVTPQYRTIVEPDGARRDELSSCVASTQAAVREAARRAAIENLNQIIDTRYVYVRP